MMRPLLICALSATIVTLTGCSGSEAYIVSQHFTLVPDTSGIGKDIPAGALALDTRTGQVCFTLTGTFQAAAPAVPLCETLARQDTSRTRK